MANITNVTINQLSDAKKTQIKNLMTSYFNNKTTFVYKGDIRRESYAYPNKLPSSGINGCMNASNKYLLNCSVFAQMIWMGRRIEDFINYPTTPTTNISKAFDWGYYFDFLSAKNAYNVKKDGKLYGLNSYVNNAGNKIAITFDNAASMAEELHRKGYEIPYSEADVGDLVFYRSESLTDGDTDELEATSFRNISHVGVVYEKTGDLVTIMEYTNVYTADMGKCILDGGTTFGMVRAANLGFREVMCARHPAADPSFIGNVPTKFEPYRHE